MNAVDCFCGAGGMTRGLLNAGINVVFGLDNSQSCQRTYQDNNDVPYVNEDITAITGQNLVNDYPILNQPDELLLVGCAPCQPFSSQRHANYEHQAVNLLDQFGRLVQELHPAHILIENVPGIEKRGATVFNRFLNLIGALEYNYEYRILNAKEYGVPQNRRRLILVASRLMQPVFPMPTHGNNLLPYVTVRQAIGHFPVLAVGDTNPDIPNHKCANLSTTNLERIHLTPHDGGGRNDWPPRLQLECHTNGHQGHTDVYGRMSWDAVSPTLTSKCFSLSNGRFGHPDQDRAISLREAAAIQTFPDNYIFYGNMQEIGRQIGNAVPVRLAEHIGACILAAHEHMNEG